MTSVPNAIAAIESALGEMRALYARLDAELAPYVRPCRADGECCRFGPGKPVLYLTFLEAAMMLASGRDTEPSPDSPNACPYLDGGRCGIRERRALGCRTFFCDSIFEEQRCLIHEKFLREIRTVEAKFQVPHFYRPLAEALREAARLCRS